MLSARDSERVSDLIREAARTELLPRFRNLAADDIRLKRPGDVVTVADVAAEKRLTSGLAAILPGAAVVGEEAVEQDPGLLGLIGRQAESCWIVDPLDGTAQYAAGTPCFAIIVSLIQGGATVAGWILDVMGDRMAVAQRGEGAFLNGVRLAPEAAALAGPPNGFAGYKIRNDFERRLTATARQRLGHVKTLGCAGVEYVEILAGNAAFNVYRTTKPWDHAAGALMLAEVGGRAVRFDGEEYRAAQAFDAGIVSASSPAVLAEVRSAIGSFIRQRG